MVDPRRDHRDLCNPHVFVPTVRSTLFIVKIQCSPRSSFDRHYYHHLPILEKVYSMSLLYQSSPFLFWTIVICSAGRHPTHKRVGAHLLPSYEALLSTTMGKPIRSIQTVHAFLVLCLWPLHVVNESDDPSWNYIGLVMNAAMQLGLHLDCRQDLFGYDSVEADEASMDVRNMTWMACFQISTQ